MPADGMRDAVKNRISAL